MSDAFWFHGASSFKLWNDECVCVRIQQPQAISTALGLIPEALQCGKMGISPSRERHFFAIFDFNQSRGTCRKVTNINLRICVEFRDANLPLLYLELLQNKGLTTHQMDWFAVHWWLVILNQSVLYPPLICTHCLWHPAVRTLSWQNQSLEAEGLSLMNWWDAKYISLYERSVESLTWNVIVAFFACP